MKKPTPGLRIVFWPSMKGNSVLCCLSADSTQLTCCATTDSTGSSIRLNSSKQPHAFDCARPRMILPSATRSCSGPQLKTTQYLPKVRARSLVVSVLPVPAGPAGAPPMYIDTACDSVM